jgi:ElaB/YqjD/DUF883 family membrane-anchored ribosome-binding protein
METTNIGSEKLMQDLKAVVSDTEELMRATAGDVSERVTRARARAAAQATNAYVHKNPWPSIGVAAGAGFLIGLLIGRR